MMMTAFNQSAIRWTRVLAALCALAFALASVVPSVAKEKKATTATAEDPKHPSKKYILEHLDTSKIVWPNPPDIARIRYVNQFYGEKRDPKPTQEKSKWMDKLAGITAGEQGPGDKLFFQLVRPYGVGVDTKGRVYTIDEKVLAVFIYNLEDQKVELIKNGVQARFSLPTGLTIDDADTLFVSDTNLHHVLVFDKQHKLESSISEGMMRPAGMAIDNENRFLYVADSEREQVLVYDADPPHKFLRAVGQPTGKNNDMSAGHLARPTNVAVDSDGNLYVADTLNNRIQIFDADGNFISMFGKPGDGPGYFSRPKGIGVDSDGHVWVADAIQDRVQVFTRDGHLLIYFGGHGELPGQFNTLAGLTIDNKNRVFTTEQYPGRIQIFRYITNEEAKAELAEREKVAGNKAGKPAGKEAAQSKPAAATPN
jgi:DNA-binding beta-propeller fold protein YncE